VADALRVFTGKQSAAATCRVNFLMRLLKSYLESNLQRMMDNNVRIRYIGRTHELPPRFRTRWLGRPKHGAQHRHDADTGAELWRRSELVDAFRALAAEMKLKHLSADRITEEDIHRICTRRTCRSGPVDKDFGRDEAFELPVVADCLHGDLCDGADVAGFRGFICWRRLRIFSGGNGAMAGWARVGRSG